MNINRRTFLTCCMAISAGVATSNAMSATKKKVGKMTLNDALKLIAAWGQSVGDSTYKGQMLTEADGGFLTMSRGAVFRFLPTSKQLLVSGVVRYNIKIMSKRPDNWDDFVKVANREAITNADGSMELMIKPLYHMEDDVVLLTRAFGDANAIDLDQFLLEVRWLLASANYWFMHRFNEVIGSSDEDLAKQSAVIIARVTANPSPLTQAVMAGRARTR